MAEAIKSDTMLNNQKVTLSTAPKNGANMTLAGVACTFSLTPLPAGAPDIVTLEPAVDGTSCVVHAVPGKTGAQNGSVTDGHITAPFQVNLQDASPVSLNLSFGTPSLDA